MILHYIRHGKTEANLTGKVSGCRYDRPLTVEGITEIQKYLKMGIYPPNPGACYTSKLLRTQQTLKLIYPDANYTPIAEFNERNFGIIEAETDIEKIRCWRAKVACAIHSGKGEDNLFVGGETTTVFFDRAVKSIFDFFEAAFLRMERVITVCGHGGFLSAVWKRCLEKQYGEMHTVIGNGKGVTFEIERDESDVFALKPIEFIGGNNLEDIMERRNEI